MNPILKQIGEIDAQREKLEAVRKAREDKRKTQLPIAHEDRRKKDRRKNSRD